MSLLSNDRNIRSKTKSAASKIIITTNLKKFSTSLEKSH